MQPRPDTDLVFGDYIGALKRRAALLAAIMGVVLLIGFAIAYRVPPLYASRGVLLAEQTEVPEHVVRSTVPDYPEDRVRIITQRVLTNDNVTRIIEENGLYLELGRTPEALSEFRQHLALSAEDPELLENIMGSNRAADAMAFSLTFTDRSPRVARDVANDLVTLYLEENQLARRELAEQTTRFLLGEARRLEEEIAEREQRLADFKREHSGSLPDSSDLNFQLLDRVERDLESVEQEIRTLRERQALYSTELAQLSPRATVLDEDGRAILAPDERLTVLQRRYAQLSAVYSQDHPDVLNVRREIDALRAAGGGSAALDQAALRAELAAREDELAAARDRYSADHPDVQRLARTVESLRSALASAPAIAAASAAPPDNPLYLQRQVQLNGAKSELAAAVARRDQLTLRLAELEDRSILAPDVERELNMLSRGYEQLLAQYDDVERKLREAEIAVNLESDSRNERFTVLEAPQLATSPAQPNRIAVLLLTLFAAFVCGAGGVALAERSDSTIRLPRDVTEHLGMPPLAAIPYIDNSGDTRRRSRLRLIAAGACGLWVALIAFFVTNPA